MKGVYNRLSVLRCVVLFRVLAVFLVALIAGFYYRPFRNLVLRPVWPRAWREFSSTEVIMMSRSSEIAAVSEPVTCSETVTPNATIEDIHLTSSSSSSFSAQTTSVPLKDERHRSFLPIVDGGEKRSILQLYVVMAEALKSVGVVHFLVEGSLLGVVRHGGFVPWDDDVDVAISVRDWPKVRTALTCLRGYQLDTKPFMHWKFHRDSGPYPFVDLFFYEENESLVWAMTSYITPSVAFALADVFPLTTARFESLTVPVPGQLVKVANSVFDVDVCQSPSLNHKTGQKLEVVTLPCSDIYYLYAMTN